MFSLHRLLPIALQRVITGADNLTPTHQSLSQLAWSNLKERSSKQRASMMFKIINYITPPYLQQLYTSDVGTSKFENTEVESSFTGCQRRSLPEKLWVHWGESLENFMRLSKKKSESLNLCMDFKLDIIIMFPIDLIESLTQLLKWIQWS